MERFELAPDSVDTPLTLPSAPAEPARAGFPWLASLAPVVGALALWAITASPFALVFAALGPLVALASMVDARRSARRQRRVAARERVRCLDELAAEIRVRHGVERAAAWRRSPSPRAMLDAGDHSAWRDDDPPSIVLGSGTAASALRVDGSPVDGVDRELLLGASRLSDAPVIADAGGGIGFVGDLSLARAAARAAVLHFALHASPRTFRVDGRVLAHASWSWLPLLPHGGGADRRALVIVDGENEEGWSDASATRYGAGPSSPPFGVIAVACHATQLPPGLASIVVLEAPDAAVLRRRGGVADAPFMPILISAAEAAAWARSAALAAGRAGLGVRAGSLPELVRLDELSPPIVAPGDRSTLAVAVGVHEGGAVELDLVRGGPHALVAGTTGSGKSEFLLAWMAALASSYPPALVSFLLVDFKGGAAFEPIRPLPHVTGIVTDLDEAEAERAVSSLRAELRHRESVLAAAGARDISRLSSEVELARLIIVVDEFQAMIERFPELGVIIVDIASRGRSLGVHLILASQRPNGIVREQVTANCAIRVSLRVMQRSDSEAVVGSPLAAEIRQDSPGRGVVDRGDGCPVLFQSAIAQPSVIDGLVATTAGLPRARRTWLDPLPTRITAGGLAALVTTRPIVHAATGVRTDEQAPGDALTIGLLDEPERQRRSIAGWSPRVDGSLLVLGAPGSGRSTALAAVEHAAVGAYGRSAVLRLEGSRGAVWETLVSTLAVVRSDAALPRLLVIDDLDARFRAWPDDYRLAALDIVEALVRESRGRGLVVAASATQVHGMGGALRDGFGSRLVLRHATRSDLVQAGGRSELWRPDDGPGAGQWHGHRVQLVDAGLPEPRTAPAVPRLELSSERVYAVAASAPRSAAEAIASLGRSTLLLAAGGESIVRAALAAHPPGAAPPVIVGDSDAWTASWGLTATLREDAGLIVHGSTAEYRALVRSRELPPLLDEGAAQCWVVEPGTTTRRARWPGAADR